MIKTFNTFLEKQSAVLILLVSAICAFVLYLFRNTGPIIDEVDSYQQIINFTNGDFRLLEISAMPGYHALMAFISKITGLSELFALRCITSIFGIFSVFVFFKLSNRINPGSGVLRSIHFFLFPSIFIYFFLLYTDILSLLLVMTMMLFALDKRYVLAGIFGILSMLVRQNNVIWTAFVPALIYFKTYGFNFSFKSVVEVLRKTQIFFIGFILFIIFIIVHGGVAIGDASHHPPFSLSSGNVFFLLFCFFVFFLPLHVANIPSVFKIFISKWWAVPISFVIAAIYWFAFHVDHPYNHIETHYFLRNLILTRFTANDGMKMLFFLPMLYAFWSLAVTKMVNNSYYLIYIFAILFLLPSWLIEQRYYMIPFVLFMVFRKDQLMWVEIVTIVYYALILWWLLPLVVEIKAFL